MFASIRGIIQSLLDDKVIIENNNIGYLITASARTLYGLNVKDEIFLILETVIKDDHIIIYGFKEQLELDWFRLLITVKGVGPKAALTIIGQVNLENLANEIIQGNKNLFKNVSGIGAKTAERIIVELKDKKLPFAQHSINSNFSSPNNEIANEAIMALTALGYNHNNASNVVKNIYNVNQEITTRELIKKSLQELAK